MTKQSHSSWLKSEQMWQKTGQFIYLMIYPTHSGMCWSEEMPWSSSDAPDPSMWWPAAPQCNCSYVAAPPNPPNSEPVTTENTRINVGITTLPHYHTVTCTTRSSSLDYPRPNQPKGKPCLLRTHVEQKKALQWGDSLQGLLREPCYQSLPGLPRCVWLAAFHHQHELDEFLLLTMCVLTFF